MKAAISLAEKSKFQVQGQLSANEIAAFMTLKTSASCLFQKNFSFFCKFCSLTAMQLGRGEYVVLSLIYKNIEAAKNTKSATGYIHVK